MQFVSEIFLSQIPIRNTNFGVCGQWVDSEKAVAVFIVCAADNGKAFKARGDVELNLRRQWGDEKYQTLVIAGGVGFVDGLLQFIEGACQCFGFQATEEARILLTQFSRE